jgi:hypothetical protein
VVCVGTEGAVAAEERIVREEARVSVDSMCEGRFLLAVAAV